MDAAEAEELYRRAFHAWNLRELALALELSRELVAVAPAHGSGWLLRGIVLYEAWRHDEARLALERALDVVPEAARDTVHVQLGHLEKSRGDYGAAAEHYRAALELSPDDAGRHVFLGALLVTAGELDAAEAVLRAGSACAKGEVDEALLHLGEVLRARERYGEARECFAAALDRNPGGVRVREALADVEKALAHRAEGGGAKA